MEEIFTRKEYMICHRPGNLLEYPEEVPSIDKLSSGIYFPKDIIKNYKQYFCVNTDDEEEVKNIIHILLKVQNNPEDIVTIYRGAPSDGTLNTGDWVTLSKKYAELYAYNNIYDEKNISKESKVYKYSVKAKYISFDGDSIEEYGYWGPTIE